MHGHMSVYDYGEIEILEIKKNKVLLRLKTNKKVETHWLKIGYIIELDLHLDLHG